LPISLGAIAALAMLTAACSSSGGTGSTGASAVGGSTSPPGLVENDWTLYGHDLSNTRLSPTETEIDATSAASLTKSWSKDGLIGVTGTPVVARGVAYFGDWTGTMWAVKTDTGQELWSTKIGGDVIGSPAVDGDFVYAASGNTLFGLDRGSGGVRWKTVTNENPYSQINASPVGLSPVSRTHGYAA
ncbi:MAG: PQQ-binding-like beta-propeller repeat protein, partial [Acidimicrobiales bacterium]